MKRFNILYLAVFLVGIGLYQMSFQFSKHTVSFFGFAENKETEINLDQPVEVVRILVAPGQKVKKGTVLAEVRRKNLSLKKSALSGKIEELQAKSQVRITAIQGDIEQLEAQKLAKQQELLSKIRAIQAEIDLNQSLIKDLKSISVQEKQQQLNPARIKIAALEEELQTTLDNFDLRIQQKQKVLRVGNQPTNAQLSQLEEEKAFYAAESEQLTITAPSDGLIGNIHCKEAEYMIAFRTLITFYEENPTLVKGYVHERMILEVKEGDTIQVASILHPEQNCLGIVTGLGSRIVEIPERLRKVPDLRNYGREVLIAIPRENNFLQKEKVALSLIQNGLISSSAASTNQVDSKTQQLVKQ